MQFRLFYATLALSLSGCVYAPPPGYRVVPVTLAPAQTTYSPAAAGQGKLTCRDVTQTVTIDGKPQQVSGSLCQQADGSWRIENSPGAAGQSTQQAAGYPYAASGETGQVYAPPYAYDYAPVYDPLYGYYGSGYYGPWGPGFVGSIGIGGYGGYGYHHGYYGGGYGGHGGHHR